MISKTREDFKQGLEGDLQFVYYQIGDGLIDALIEGAVIGILLGLVLGGAYLIFR